MYSPNREELVFLSSNYLKTHDFYIVIFIPSFRYREKKQGLYNRLEASPVCNLAGIAVPGMLWWEGDHHHSLHSQCCKWIIRLSFLSSQLFWAASLAPSQTSLCPPLPAPIHAFFWCTSIQAFPPGPVEAFGGLTAKTLPHSSSTSINRELIRLVEYLVTPDLLNQNLHLTRSQGDSYAH